MKVTFVCNDKWERSVVLGLLKNAGIPCKETDRGEIGIGDLTGSLSIIKALAGVK